MSRIQAITEFLTECRTHGLLVESQNRYDLIRSRLFELINSFNPGVILKAGLGTGRLVGDIARNVSSVIVVVEPSMTLIRDFVEAGENRDILSKVRLVNGSLTSLPVDYYACDLVVCVDYLDIVDSSRIIDEFRRVLQFEKHLFISGTVLAEDDLDGVFDELMHAVFPLHNDYYLAADLATILELNEFRMFKEKVDLYRENMAMLSGFFNGLYPGHGDISLYVAEHAEELIRLYDMKDGSLALPYYTAVYSRKKPPAEQQGTNPYKGTPL